MQMNAMHLTKLNDSANEWFHAFLLALVMLTAPWVIPSTWGFVLLLLVYGAPYSLAHSIWVHRLEWAGESPDFVSGIVLALLFYTALFRYSVRLWRIASSRLDNRTRR